MRILMFSLLLVGATAACKQKPLLFVWTQLGTFFPLALILLLMAVFRT
jgi:hypothetical protein